MAKKPETPKNAPPPASDAAGASAPANKKRSRLVMPLLVLMLVSATGAGAWYGGLRNHPALAFAPKPATTAKKAQAFIPLEPFTVNLQDTDRERFLQLAVVLEVNDGNAADGVKQKLPIIRSQILLLLSSKRSPDLQGVAAKQTLASEIIAVQHLQAGEWIGYGQTYQVTQEMTIGIVACGYGDGYPRHAPAGTPVLVAGQRTRTVGRVSMDMISVDISDIAEAYVGTPVTLWGEGLSCDEVAASAGTVSYELLCALAPRVPVVEA